jgi:hypothetical protein
MVPGVKPANVMERDLAKTPAGWTHCVVGAHGRDLCLIHFRVRDLLDRYQKLRGMAIVDTLDLRFVQRGG